MKLTKKQNNAITTLDKIKGTDTIHWNPPFLLLYHSNIAITGLSLRFPGYYSRIILQELFLLLFLQLFLLMSVCHLLYW